MACRNVVRNPVCEDCLSKELESLLVDYRQDLIDKFRDINSFLTYPHTNMFCVICGSSASICKKCYEQDIMKSLTEESLLENTFAEALLN